MSTLVSLHHVTRYRYDRPVALGPHAIRLRPAPYGRTAVPSYSLTVSPEQHYVNWQHDPHGNWIARYVFGEKTTELVVTVDLLADIAIANPFDFLIETYADSIPFSYSDELRQDLGAYLEPEPAGPRLTSLLATISRTPRSTVEFLVDLNQRVSREVRYLVRMDPGVQTPEETLEAASGSCRDSAWVLIQVLRHLGLAARFVSGYLIQLKPDIVAADGPAGVAQDFADLHAWAEVYLPGAGWVGFDPTSGLMCGGGDVPLAATPHHRSAAPITGSVEPADVRFDVEMTVSRVADRPRVSLPFSEGAWAALDALGEAVDRDLVAQDVRLTTGGEPTFVSLDDYQSAEWRTAALGGDKKARAGELVRRLARRFAPGALLHCGRGKWYPGEAQPRWAFSLHWRRDGKPVWRDRDLISADTADVARIIEDAHSLTAGIAEALGLATANVIPAFEDPLHLLDKEAALPINIDPLDPAMAAGDARARMVRALQEQVGVPAGYVLPLWPVHSGAASARWISEAWEFRRGKLLLLTGDGPVGDRLPLGALPHIDPADYPVDTPLDPLADRDDLPEPDALRATVGAQPTPCQPEPVRTALSVEPREGQLCVFMPPLDRLDDYLVLVGAVEAAAAARKIAVRIEGYRPPVDPRVNSLSVTPDPGVIEVNVHPAASWREAIEITRGVYEDAQGGASRQREIPDGRPPDRHRRRQSRGARRRRARGQSVPAPARPPQEHRALLAAASRAVIPVLRPVRRTHQPGAARRRGAPRLAARTGDRASRTCRCRARARRRVRGWSTAVPQPPGRCDRQYPPRRDLHRQALLARQPDRPIGPGRVPRLRDAADARMSLAQQLLVRALVTWFWREPQARQCVALGHRAA